MKKPNKFNSESDLAEAYAALEVEFTKRCQKIKELEALIEKAEESGNNGECATEGIEPRKSYKEGGEDKLFDSVIDECGSSDLPHGKDNQGGAREGENSTSREIVKSDNGENSPLLRMDDNLIKPSDIKKYVAEAVREAIEKMRQSQATEPAAPSLAQAQQETESDDEAFAAIISSEKVKRAVIAEYLSALKERNGFEAVKGRVVLTPPSRPTSLEEAKRIIDGLMR